MRCLTLAEELKKTGAEIKFISRAHEGNLIAYISEKDFVNIALPKPQTLETSNKKIEKNVNKLLEEENKFGIKNLENYFKFSKNINSIKENVLNNLRKIKKNFKIIGYGSPAKATTLLNFFGADKEIFDFIVEDNKFKVTLAERVLDGVIKEARG